MEILKLKAHPYAQAYIVKHNGGTIDLYSYQTKVITITPSGWLTCFGLYSRTTRKHISAFAKEYTNIFYQDIKTLYENNLKFNIFTDEVL